MAAIINNTQFTLSPEAQQAVQNAAECYGTDRVYVSNSLDKNAQGIHFCLDAGDSGDMGVLDTVTNTVIH